MLKTAIIASVLAATAGVASANIPDSVGVGVESQINGTGGVSVNYDAGKFHAGGFLGVADPSGPDNTAFDIGGRFFFHVHQTASSDFSVGGSIGILHADLGPNNSEDDVFIEPSFQIRIFVVPNVALSFTGGFVIGANDASGLAVTGQTVGSSVVDLGGGAIGITGGAGVHYYFN